MGTAAEGRARASETTGRKRCGWRALLADLAGDVSAPEATPLVAGLIRRLDDDGPWPRHELQRAWVEARFVPPHRDAADADT